VNAGLVLRILEAKRFGKDKRVPPKGAPVVAISTPLKGLKLHKAKMRWQAVFDVPDVAWFVHDDQARNLEKLGMSDAEVLTMARETIEASGDSWEEFFWRAEATRMSKTA